ncbi:COPZ2 [Auxenochlorella protothecoides x Auxenochlorella symbiontica]
MAIDRVGAVVIATRQGGNVVYERFYGPFSEPEKGELREAMHQATAHQPPDSADEALGQYRSGRIVAVPTGELCFYAVGHGEYNELALSEILNALINIYKQLYRVSTLTDAVLFSKYPQTALALDEVLKEGIVQHLDSDSVARAIACKVSVIQANATSKSHRGKSLRGMFSSVAAATGTASPV